MIPFAQNVFGKINFPFDYLISCAMSSIPTENLIIARPKLLYVFHSHLKMCESIRSPKHVAALVEKTEQMRAIYIIYDSI